MAYLKFLDLENPVRCTVIPDGNIVTIQFPEGERPLVDTSGFRLYMDYEMQMDIGGDSYVQFNTIYRNDETTGEYNGYQLSNDGSMYVAPVPTVMFSAGIGGRIEGRVSQDAADYADLVVPVPVPGENYVFDRWVPEISDAGIIEHNMYFQAVFVYVPTLEEVREEKVAEMNAMQQAAIQAGINVTLSDGTVEHFTLTDHDQTSLMGLQSQVLAGEQNIPWHNSNEAEHCRFYSNADMDLITAAAMACVTWHVTYFRDLRIYIRSLTEKKDLEAVTYGMDIPVEYQSVPLQVMIAAKNV